MPSFDLAKYLTIGSVSQSTTPRSFEGRIESFEKKIDHGQSRQRTPQERSGEATMMTKQDAETVYSSTSRTTAGGSSYRERRTTPWKHREAIVNGIRIHYVEAEPFRRVQSPLADPGSAEAPGQSSSEPTFDGTAQQPPLLLLLHGFPEFYFSWRFQITSFASAGYRVVAPDLRGYNLSEKPGAGYTINTLVEDVRHLILHLTTSDEHPRPHHPPRDKTDKLSRVDDVEAPTRTAPGDVYLMGNDWGGVLASAVASRYPQLVSKLVMVEAVHLAALEGARIQKQTVPYSRITSIGSVIRYCPPVLPELLLSYNRSWLLSNLFCPSTPSQLNRGDDQPSTAATCELPSESVCCAVSTKVPDAAPTSEEDLYRNAMSQPGAVTCMLAYFRYLSTSLKQSRAYDKIRCPVLVVWGAGEDPEHDDDALLAKSHVDVLQLTCELPVELLLIPRTSTTPPRPPRWIHEDEPEKVNQCVLRFLRTRGVMRREMSALSK
jgi:epoxide hydrolase 4